MDLIIVSIIILAAMAYTGNRFYKKYTAARSGVALGGCTSSQDNSGGCASCAACVQITNQSAITVQDEKN